MDQIPEDSRRTVGDVIEEMGLSPSRISQLTNGYRNRHGAWIPAVLVEGIDYTREVRMIEGPAGVRRRELVLFTEKGIRRLQEDRFRPMGRPRKGAKISTVGT